jgi:hypothetical protein
MKRSRRRNQKKYARRKKERALAALAVRALQRLHEPVAKSGTIVVTLDGQQHEIPGFDLGNMTKTEVQNALDSAGVGGRIRVV